MIDERAKEVVETLKDVQSKLGFAYSKLKLLCLDNSDIYEAMEKISDAETLVRIYNYRIEDKELNK